MATIKSQMDQRREQQFTDQHNRHWHAQVELKTGDPCGVIMALFDAPIMPPLKYVEPQGKNRRPYDVLINYALWKSDVREANRAWEKEARELSRKMYRDQYNPDDPFTREVVDVVGPRPYPIELVIACEQANSWALGFVTECRIPRLKAIYDLYFAPTVVEDDMDFRDEDFSDADEDVENDEHFDPGSTGGKRVDPRAEKPAARVVSRQNQSGKKKSRRARKPRTKLGTSTNSAGLEPE